MTQPTALIFLNDPDRSAQAANRLADVGVRSMTAASPRQVGAMCDAEEPSLLVVEGSLAPEPGLELVRWLRRGGVSCPVLFMCGSKVEAASLKELHELRPFVACQVVDAAVVEYFLGYADASLETASEEKAAYSCCNFRGATVDESLALLRLNHCFLPPLLFIETVCTLFVVLLLLRKTLETLFLFTPTPLVFSKTETLKTERFFSALFLCISPSLFLLDATLFPADACVHSTSMSSPDALNRTSRTL